MSWTNPFYSKLSSEDVDRIDAIVEAFQQNGSRGEDAIERLLPDSEPLRIAALLELALTDMELRHDAGETVQVESYLARFPEETEAIEVKGFLIQGEHELLKDANPDLALEDYQQRFGLKPEQLRPYLPDIPERSFRIYEVCPKCNEPVPIGSSSTEGAVCPGCKERFEQIDRFILLRHLGQGTFGTVDMAYDPKMRRKVAIKRSVTAIPQSEDRIKKEAQRGPGLLHPNIVSVYEVGEMNGRVYIVQELVTGGALDERINGIPWEPREAATLIKTLSEAAHFAHEKGIIHCDLKPANILLQDHEDQANSSSTDNGSFSQKLGSCTPKLGDFGLARYREASQASMASQMAGTPSYMAPEQAQGQPEKIGPGTDVCALGAILYELLTGRPPFQGPNPAITISQVLEQDPVSPRELQSQVDRDLETICLKCLRKEPSRRYESAQDLAQDLDLWLQGQPITARPVGMAERLVKTVRRNPGLSALSMATALAIFGVIIATWIYNVKVKRVGARAERNFQHAMQANLRFGDLVNELDGLVPTRARNVKRMLEVILGNYDRLIKEVGAKPDLLAGKGKALNVLSNVHVRLGNSTGALQTAQQSLKLHDEILKEHPPRPQWQAEKGTAYLRRGRVIRLRGSLVNGLKDFHQALAIFQRILKDHPNEWSWQKRMAQTQYEIGLTLQAMGDFERSDAAYQKALEIRAHVAKHLPNDHDAENHLGDSLRKQAEILRGRGELKQAKAGALRAFNIADKLVKLNSDQNNWQKSLLEAEREMGDLALEDGDRTKAEQWYSTALKAARTYGQVDPEKEYWRGKEVELLFALSNLRKTEQLKDMLIEQKTGVEALIAILESQIRKDPHNAMWQAQEGMTHLSLAMVRFGLFLNDSFKPEHMQAALKAVSQAEATAKKVQKKDPDNHTLALSLTISRKINSEILRLSNPKAAAEARELVWKEYMAFFQRKLKQDPDHIPWIAGMAQAHFMKAEERTQSRKWDEAIQAFQESDRLYKTVSAKYTESNYWLEKRMRALNSLKNAYMVNDRHKEGLDLARQAVELHRTMAQRRPDEAKWQWKLVEAYRALADAIAQADQGSEEEEATYRKSLDELQKALQQDSRDPLLPPTDEESIALLKLISRLLGGAILSNARSAIQTSEMQWDEGQQPQVLAEARLIDLLLDFFRQLDPHAEERRVEEGRWALRRAISLMELLKSKGVLHPAHAILLGHAQKHLKKLQPQSDGDNPPGEAQASLDRLDYQGLLKEVKLSTEEWLTVLGDELRSASRYPWCRASISKRIAQAIHQTPDLYPQMVKTAEQLKKDDKLTSNQRRLISLLKKTVPKG